MARRWKVLIVTAVAAFMALLDVTIVNIAFPDLRRSFPTASLADLSWTINAYSVVFAALLVPAGRMADRFGRKRLFMAGVLLFLVASVVCGLTGSVPVLIAGRSLQALGGAILIPASLSLTLQVFPARMRATATALWTATGAIAAATGPSLGGVLVDWQGWRAVFFVNLLIGLPALSPASRLLAESKDPDIRGWPDLLGAALLAVSVGALALALVKGHDWGWGSANALGSFGIAAVAMAAFLARSARHPRPVIDLSLFRVRSFAVANAGTFVFGAGFFALLLNNVLFLTTAWHHSVLQAGVELTPGPIAAALAAPLAGRLADRYGQRAIAIPGTILFGAAPLLLTLNAGPEPHYWTTFFPWAVMGGVGVGLSLPAFGSAAVAELPRSQFATGSAISNCSRQIGAVVGIATLVAVVGAPASVDVFHRAWALIAACGLVAGLISIALGRIRARDVGPRNVSAGRARETAEPPF